jgi:hypothetical protein
MAELEELDKPGVPQKNPNGIQWCGGGSSFLSAFASLPLDDAIRG